MGKYTIYEFFDGLAKLWSNLSDEDKKIIANKIIEKPNTINIENLTFPNVKDSSDIEKAIKDLPKNIKQIIKGGIISGK